ncbi:MAG: TolC family protein [Anaerolineae bacterium]|nr:TolC family protein [Gloeobacterales cyanobacterium ES-bin-313]
MLKQSSNTHCFMTLGFAMALCLQPAPLYGQSANDLNPIVPAIPNASFELKVQTIRPLKLQEAIKIGLERSPQLQLSQISIGKAEAVLRQNNAGLFPTASLSASYTYNQTAQSAVSAALSAQSFGGASGLFQSESVPVTGEVSLNWTVFSSGLVGSRILAANESLKATRLDYERTCQDLINNIITAYYNLQTADGNVLIGEASVRSAEASLKDATAQEKVGVGTRFSVLQAEVQLANARQNFLQYTNQRIVSQRELARQLNFAVPTDVNAADPIEKGENWEMSLEDTILKAYRGRVELERYLAQERSAKASEASYYASVSPQVSLFFTGQIYDNLVDPVTGIYSGYSIGAKVQWSAFDGGVALAQADQAIADAKSARLNYIDNRNTIRYAVENAYSTLLTSTLQISTATSAVVSAEESLRLARLRFQAGIGTQTDVITADRDLAQSRVNRLNAIIDYNKSIAALKRATGTL